MSKLTRQRTKSDVRLGFGQLRAACCRLRFQPHDIGHALDRSGRYDLDLDREFPFVISLFHFTSKRHTRAMTWHERLELFLVVAGRVRFRMGDQEFMLEAGDLLAVDNLKLHQVVDFPGFNARVVVISFMPEFVYSLGSPAHDHAFLLPFYARVEQEPHVLRPGDSPAPRVYTELAELLACYFKRPPLFQTGCKAILLRVLHHLAQRFQTSEVLRAEFLRRQEQAQQLQKLLEHIESHYAERLAVQDAARLVGMSPARFIKVFKRVAGMTFVSYVTHVRLSRAARILRESIRLVADVAAETGFTDQSYFVRQFRRHFGQTPIAYRRNQTVPPSASKPVREVVK